MRHCFALLALVSLPAAAEPASDALIAQLPTICAAAVPGSDLFQRCDEIFGSSDPTAVADAADGQKLEEVPGQVRIATRDTAVRARTELGPQWSAFFSADIGRLDRRASEIEAPFDADTDSLTLGINWQPSSKWLLGLAANQVRESLDYRASEGSVDTRFDGLIAFISHPFGAAWSLDGYAGRLSGDYRLRRAIAYTLGTGGSSVTVNSDALANPGASRDLVGFAANGSWSRQGWDIGTTFGVDDSKIRIDPYTETGGDGFAIAVAGRSTSTRRARADFRLGRTVSWSGGVWQPSFRIGWRQEAASPRRTVTVRFVEDPSQTPVTFDTEESDRGWGELALGSVFTFKHGQSAFIEYRQRFAHAFLQERVLALGWRMEL
jgi:uncharacterized protein with beta-barrel porin domain